MNRLNIFFKYSLVILIVPYISCENLPLRDIDVRLDAEPSYTCWDVQKITHNLSLDDEITNRLNKICWRKNFSENFKWFYLVAVTSEFPSEGTAVDVPFRGSAARVTFFDNNKLELNVPGVTDETWHVICEFQYVLYAQIFFNAIYEDQGRRTVPIVQSFAATQIRKYPNFGTAQNPFSSLTYIYRESDRQKTTYIFTESQQLSNPILIISTADYKIETPVGSAVSLRVIPDENPYVLYFNSVQTCSDFYDRVSQSALP